MLFDKVQNYDQIRKGYSKNVIHSILSLVNDSPSVLDVGGGTGQLAFALEPFCSDIKVVDSFASSIIYGKDKAQKCSSKVSFEVASAQGFRSAKKFDLIISSQSYMYFAGEDYLSNCYHHLEDGGVLCLMWKYPVFPQWINSICIRHGLQRAVELPKDVKDKIESSINDNDIRKCGLHLISSEVILSKYRYSLHDLVCLILWSAGFDGASDQSFNMYDILCKELSHNKQSLGWIGFNHYLYCYGKEK